MILKRCHLVGGALASVLEVQRAQALEPKAGKLPPTELAKRFERDLLENQFLATANFDRVLYDKSRIFTDEIDTYELDKLVYVCLSSPDEYVWTLQKPILQHRPVKQCYDSAKMLIALCATTRHSPTLSRLA